MKKFTLYTMTLIMLSLIPTQSNAESATGTVSLVEIKKIESAQADVLIARLKEIKATDKSNMSRAEKKELRKEVRSIKKSLNDLGGGIYLSVGAIIIIILLLILLL